MIVYIISSEKAHFVCQSVEPCKRGTVIYNYTYLVIVVWREYFHFCRYSENAGFYLELNDFNPVGQHIQVKTVYSNSR
jgi:hypothetical protein